MEGNLRSPGGILSINLMFFYTSFFCSGTQSMVSQLFFDSYYPDRKYELLALTLFLGAMATLAGLLAGKRLQNIHHRLSALFVLVGVVGFAVQMHASSVYVYVSAFMIASFSINLLFNVFDNYFMKVVGESSRAR
jgi:hypothetical protein